VLRGRLAAAMGDASGTDAVPLLAAFTAKHEALNSTTLTCVSSLSKIGQRIGAKAVTSALIEAFPPASAEANAVKLARAVHDALVAVTADKGVAAPKGWSEAEHTATVGAWKKRVRD
jgi:hypothetical protein